MANLAVEVVDLSKTYRSGDEAVSVLRGVQLGVESGQSAAVIGPSGSGKSTLLACMAGLDQPDQGRVVIAGTDLASLKQSALASFRGATMGFIFQGYRLLPALTAEENVRVPLELAGVANAGAQAREWLERVGLGHRFTHRPSRLSGGEQQRVALARALAPEPAVVFADEPTGNLDGATAASMADLLLDLPSAHGTALILVTHDPQLAARADVVHEMRDGQLQTTKSSHG